MIRLGQLIVDPRQPTDRLGKGPLELGSDDYVFPHCPEFDVTFTHNNCYSYGIGLGAAIASMLPFGIKGHYEKSSAKIFEIEKIESQSLVPSEEYVRRSLMQPVVRQYLATKNHRKSLYMIVGIKLGCNAQIIQARQDFTSGTVSVDFPGAAAGIPVDPKLHVGVARFRSGCLGRKIPHTFVFAYRLREIRYSVKSDLIFDKLYTKGAQLNEFSGDMMASTSELIENAGEGSDGYARAHPEVEIEYDGLSGEDVSEEWDIDCQHVDGCILVDTPQQLQAEECDKSQDGELSVDVSLAEF